MSTTDIGGIKARIELDTARFKAGVNETKRKLHEVDGDAKKTTMSFEKMAAALSALGASAALVGLVRTVKALADEANALQSSLTGVSEVAKALGHDVKAVTDAAEQLAARGFMTLQQSADALKTTLATGYGLEESITLINALGDAAAYNRESHLSWGEAVVNAVRGIKAQNSNLTDSAGITTNLSIMYEKYAATIGTSAAKLTDAQKAQAAYNGMVAEAAMFAGNAETAMAGYTGTQAEFNKTIETARAELGEAYLPMVQKITEEMTPLIKQFSGWASENKEVVATVTATTAGLLGLATAIGVITVAVRGLNAALGPIGWAITILGAVVTGVTAYTAAANSASKSAKDFADNQSALNKTLEKTNGILNAQTYNQTREQIDALNQVVQRHIELMREYNELEAAANSGRGSIENTHRMFDLADAVKAVNRELSDMGYENVEAADFALRGMKKSVDNSLGALVELTRQQMQSNIAAADAVNTLEELSAEYDDLNKLEKLSEEQKSRLAGIVKELKREYPDLITQLDEENRWHIANKDALDGYIQGERDRVKAAIESARGVIQAAKVEAEERVRLANKANEEIEKIEAKNPQTASFVSDGLAGFIQAGAKAAVDNTKKKLTDEVNQARFEINNANKLLDDLAVGIDAFRTNTSGGTAADNDRGGGSTAIKQTAEQIAQQAYQAALKQLEIRRLLGKLTEEEEEKRMAELAEKYKKFDDIWIDAESRRQRIAEQIAADRERAASQSARDRFDHSADWIEQETRRMTLAGETEEAIAHMKLEAWSRVRGRYEKDSEYYKRADTELYNLRVALMRKTEQAAADAQKQAKDSASNAIKAIDAQKKAELDALNERRKAIKAFYDDQAKLIDDGERQRERVELEAEAVKYSGATSDKGRRHYAEILEKLRLMDVDDQRRALEEERDAKLEALDEQQADIESWYNDMKTLLEDYNGDFIAIYQRTEDARFKAFTSTNAKIMSELQRFQAEYEAAMSTVGSGSTASVVAQMSANAKAWHTADKAGKERLSAENQRLGASIGASKDASTGKWFDNDGTPLFHTGRDGVTGGTFSAGDMLMPDEITAILRDNEYVFTPGQLRSLLDGVGGRGGGNTYIEKVVGVEMHDTTLEDEIDMRAIGRTGVDMAEAMRRSGYQGTGGKP